MWGVMLLRFIICYCPSCMRIVEFVGKFKDQVKCIRRLEYNVVFEMKRIEQAT